MYGSKISVDSVHHLGMEGTYNFLKLNQIEVLMYPGTQTNNLLTTDCHNLHYEGRI